MSLSISHMYTHEDAQKTTVGLKLSSAGINTLSPLFFRSPAA